MNTNNNDALVGILRQLVTYLETNGSTIGSVGDGPPIISHESFRCGCGHPNCDHTSPRTIDWNGEAVVVNSPRYQELLKKDWINPGDVELPIGTAGFSVYGLFGHGCGCGHCHECRRANRGV